MDNRADRIVDLETLRRRIARLEGSRRAGGSTVIRTGCAALDAILPDGGVRSGSLIEWISASEGLGTHSLALLAAREACRDGGLLTAIDRRREFYPPAVVRLGIQPEQLLVVHPGNAADHDWAMDQVLRSPAVAVTVAWPKRLDDRTFRRWQLAVEEGGGLGILLRPASARSEPSWADVRIWVEPLPAGAFCSVKSLPVVKPRPFVIVKPRPVAAFCFVKPRPVVAPHTATTGRGFTTGSGFTQNDSPRCRRLRLTLLRCRGAVGGRSIDVELDDETYCVHPLERERLPMAN